jgi:anthranilate synthase component 2
VIAVIDNYDSFHLQPGPVPGDAGAEIEVHRNDAIRVDDLAAKPLDGPGDLTGPGEPRDAGIRRWRTILKLGGAASRSWACDLGHQGLGEAYGG